MRKNFLQKKILLIAIILSLFIVFFSISNISAVDTTITNETSEGGIKGAQSSGFDEIYLKAGVYSGDNNTNIIINSNNLTIIGNDSRNNVIIDGENINKIFTVSPNYSLTLINLTIRNAFSNNNGGAIFTEGKLTIINCSFINNEVSSNNVYGGAIYSTGNYLLINNSKFEKNKASEGGAIYSNGNYLSIYNSSFENNEAGEGGAIQSNGNNTQIIDSNFTNNSALGGAIILGWGSDYVSNVSINNCIFVNNSGEASGGAIYVYGGDDITISGSKFINGTADSWGAAIFNTRSNLTIYGCFFENNVADLYGGSISNGGNMTIENSEFLNNSALLRGGAIYNTGNLAIESSDFSNNYLINSANTAGGAIFLENSGTKTIVNILNSNFTNNTSNNTAGAIYSRSNITLNITKSLFENNKATFAGAIYATSNVTLYLSDSVFLSNNATTGGVIYNNEGSTIFLSKNQMDENTATLGTEIYNLGIIKVLNLTYLNNSTVKVKNNTYILINATLTDDMGNTITGRNISFYVNGTLIGTAESIEGKANMSYFTGNFDGIIPVYGLYNDNIPSEIIIKNGQLLSSDGADLNGTISFDKDEYLVNETVNGVITVSNNGTGTSKNVSVKIDIPNDFITDEGSIYVSQGYFDNNTNIWYIGDLNPDVVAKMTFSGKFTEKGNHVLSVVMGADNVDSFIKSITIIVDENPNPNPNPNPTPTPNPNKNDTNTANDTNQTSNNHHAIASMKKTAIPLFMGLLILLSTLGLIFRKH